MGHVSLRVDVNIDLAHGVPDRVSVQHACLGATNIVDQDTHITWQLPGQDGL